MHAYASLLEVILLRKERSVSFKSAPHSCSPKVKHLLEKGTYSKIINIMAPGHLIPPDNDDPPRVTTSKADNMV
jgi:hypothetical protein